ncbi:hypothetical protein L596_008348 [Steinernema carpocapsae]|uniref:Uncharacterized protein n=1 Tax=Steinernema carpocapsae TaxID=34508 RepID=A0A4U5PCQ4_STECR|nr:hypothetical protein L596_008348 [Steinernema carpocapsae]
MGRRRSYSTSSAYANPAFETIPEGRETPSPMSSRRGSGPGSTIAALMGMSAPFFMVPEKAKEIEETRKKDEEEKQMEQQKAEALLRQAQQAQQRRGSVPLLDIPQISVMIDEVPDQEDEPPKSNFLVVPGGSRYALPPEEGQKEEEDVFWKQSPDTSKDETPIWKIHPQFPNIRINQRNCHPINFNSKSAIRVHSCCRCHGPPTAEEDLRICWTSEMSLNPAFTNQWAPKEIPTLSSRLPTAAPLQIHSKKGRRLENENPT